MRNSMKIFILIISLTVLSISNVFAADMPIQANQLPQNAQSFVKTNFPSDQIVYAEQDRNSFKVELQSGVEIDFDKSGNWTDVSSKMPLPTGFIPANVLKSVQGKYPQVAIMEISKEYKLQNKREHEKKSILYMIRIYCRHNHKDYHKTYPC